MDRRIRAKTDGDAGHDTTHNDHAHPSYHMHHMDPSLMVFFTLKDLKLGKTMAIYFPKRKPSKSPHLLPREEADLFPFSSKQLHHLLQVFSFSQDSPQAKAMEDTLRECETEPIKGEIKSCATSLESKLDFACGVLGLDSIFSVVSTTHLTNSTTHLQNCTILEKPKEVLAPKMVACHTMPYPYAVFYCHSQESMNKVYRFHEVVRIEIEWMLLLFATLTPLSGALIMLHFRSLGLSQALPLCAISFLLIILYVFQPQLMCNI